MNKHMHIVTKEHD